MQRIEPTLVAAHNERLQGPMCDDYESLADQLARRKIDIEAVRQRAASFGVAIPSWGVGTGGTRFARFPGRGEPRNVFEKL